MARTADIFAKTQRVMQRLDQEGKGVRVEATRASMIEAVAETYRLEGLDPDLNAIAAAVDKVLAEEEAVASQPPKRKIPTHYWVLGGIIALPLLFPLIRLLEALVSLLIRIAI